MATWTLRKALLSLTLALVSSSHHSTPIRAQTVGFLEPIWRANLNLQTTKLAWGDFDGDGDLDLAVSAFSISQPGVGLIYRNDAGRLQAGQELPNAGDVQALAWGDVDNDGDLDLAFGPRLFINVEGKFVQDPSWAPASQNIHALAWGDVDRDGDLDLAVGNNAAYSQSGPRNQLFRNQGGRLFLDQNWMPPLSLTESLAWGDVDRDGDLDLVVGSWGQPNGEFDRPLQLFRNELGSLVLDTSWAPRGHHAKSVAWGDFDSDGDLDLAAGGLLFRNDQGSLVQVAWSTQIEPNFVTAVAWGDMDGDGDLDLAVGNSNFPRADELYRNDGGSLVLDQTWAPRLTQTSDVAWGDVDGDGDLDLVTGGTTVDLYRNTGDIFTDFSRFNQVPSAGAWADADGNGRLDYIARYTADLSGIFKNAGNSFVLDQTWGSITSTATSIQSMAWGDVDSDNDVDLAIGRAGAPSELYLNSGTSLVRDQTWIPEAGSTTAMSWGDVDNDGDLDLATIKDGFLELYRNENGRLSVIKAWTTDEHLVQSRRLVWADLDRDGDLDLLTNRFVWWNVGGELQIDTQWASFIGNNDFAIGDVDGDGNLEIAPIQADGVRIFRNKNGAMSADAAVLSVPDTAQSVGFGDFDEDGDLDIAVGTSFDRLLFRNDSGTFLLFQRWSDPFGPLTISWVDSDQDGVRDVLWGISSNLHEGAVRYIRDRVSKFATATNRLPQVRIPCVNRGGCSPTTATAGLLTSQIIDIPFVLADAESDPVSHVQGWYSLDGGGNWRPAIATSGTLTAQLTTSPEGSSHVFHWDTFASGVFGRSDNVVFRIVATPDASRTGGMLFQRASVASTSSPFRVRSTQIRVVDAANNPLRYARVLRRESGQTKGGSLGTGTTSFETDGSGFLSGRGELKLGDELVALWPVTTTSHYTLYQTSATPVLIGLTAYPVTAAGVQTLTVTPQNPLLVFNLSVSLEWDARYDPQYLARLKSDFERVGDLLYDWTNGQATLGDITIYHNKEKWNDADIRIYATNRLRPNANQGGIVNVPISETLTIGGKSKTIDYEPGQVRIGATWNRFGESGSNLGDDWTRTLAHELGHYAFYLEDNYLGLDTNGRLISVDTCQSAMSDPYRDDYTEFHPPADWLPNCKDTLSNRELGRSDWETIVKFYPNLITPTSSYSGLNAGPTNLPLAITQVRFVTPTAQSTALAVPIFYLKMSNGAPYDSLSGGAQAFLFRGDRITDLGLPNGDQLLARGAQPGDQICFYDLLSSVQGCSTVAAGSEQLQLRSYPDWQPDVAVTPITSQTIVISMTNVPTDLTGVTVRVYPSYVETNTQQVYTTAMMPSTSGYSATITTGNNLALLDGYVLVSDGTRQLITSFTVGGNPGKQRARLSPRGDPGKQRARLSPVLSSDGQAILFTPDDVPLPDGAFYNIQTVSLVPTPPLWATVVGQGYRLTASPLAPSLAGSSLNIGYLEKSVPPGEEDGIQMYFLPDGASAWVPLTTTLNTRTNEATALISGPGRYALMTSLKVSLGGIGWNLFGYPSTLTRPASDALASIAGQYSVIYGYVISDTNDPWKIFSLSVPDYVNDLQTLSYGNGYWIDMAQPATLLLKGRSTNVAATHQAETNLPSPPATYYGDVLSWPDGPALPNQVLVARVDNVECGHATTSAFNGRIVYSIDVSSDAAQPGCGASGRMVALYTLDSKLVQTIVWRGSGIFQYTISSEANMTLLSFTARQSQTAVHLAWTTGSQVNISGFALYRSITGRRQDAVRVTNDVITAKGGNQETQYLFKDQNVTSRSVYTYWLQAISTNGQSLEYGPVMTRGPILNIYLYYLPFAAR